MSSSMNPKAVFHKAAGSMGITAMLLLITVICLFPPPILFFRQLTAYTLFIMIGLFVLGMIAFLIKQERIMMVSLACCCVLCLYLKGSANKQMRLSAVTSNPSLKITYINLGNAENAYDPVIDYVSHVDADFISFQELTPDWNTELTKKLSTEFGYIKTMTRLDQYGMGFFSKIPFQSLDTIYFHEIPNLVASVNLGENQMCHIISCQVIPPVNEAAFLTISQHFNYLTGYMKNLKGNVIVLGDLHLPPWASEIQQFKITANLQDSRRDTNPRNQDGTFSLPRIPVEHIFYGTKFDCTSFSELGNSVVGRIGITGTYQIHNADAQVVQ